MISCAHRSKTTIQAQPVFIEAYWADPVTKNKVTTGKHGEDVAIYIKLNDSLDVLKSVTSMSIDITEWDPTYFDGDEKKATITNVVVNNCEVFHILKIEESWYDRERDYTDELYFTPTFNVNDFEYTKELPEQTDDYLQVKIYKVAIAGNDADSSSDRKSLRDGAEFFKDRNYAVISDTIKTGEQFIQVLNDFPNKPIESLVISSHGCPYAIDFQTSGSNLYISRHNVQSIVRAVNGFASWTPQSEARYISDIALLVGNGTLSRDIHIMISACLTGSTPSIVNSIPGTPDFNVSWATLNSNKTNPENFAQQLSQRLSQATIIASNRRVDSGTGMAVSSIVIYQNGVLLPRSNQLYKEYSAIVNAYRTR